MNKIHVLDCTLRDGGYCNEWRFGYENIKKITNGLLEANVEIIECGFLTKKVNYNKDVTKFTNVEEIKKIIPSNRNGKIFVVMINYGEYDIDDLPVNDGSSIDGVRVAFHKNNLFEALELCRQIKAKGYLVFIQAMVSVSYSDNEFLSLIRETNEIKPYAFYIVDSFGIMKGKDLIRLFYMVEHNLNDDIFIGFHSHNNMQLSYSNAQTLATIQTNRNLIIDASIYGMGRGAGNLNTELFVEYLNENTGKQYNLKPLLVLIDEIINEFYQMNYWGYSLPNYISAKYNAHPNYAKYLDDKKTLTIEAMNDIFEMMNDDKKISYDKKYIEKLYIQYMAKEKIKEEHKNELKEALSGKKILLIAPGKSSIDEKDKIIKCAEDRDVVKISINYAYDIIPLDFIFLSNLRRYKELDNSKKTKCIVTSNIPSENVYFQANYITLLNDEEAVNDNAGLMAIKFFMNYDVEGIYLAGFDGYSHDDYENYGNSEMTFSARNFVLDAMNIGISKVLAEYCKDVKLQFITTQKFLTI
ncbi:MAG: aldolase catalytic domain-containing protein [Lachnospiraceae bacterium]|nr:aldolase catalytic domain-containing protein [Lachnospiraceae bacterium]